MNIFRLKNPPNVFMNMDNGEIFYSRDGRDYPIKTKVNDNRLLAHHNGYTLDILKIVLEALGVFLNGTERMSYKVSRLGYISPKSVKIVRAPEGDGEMFKWKCDIKASGSNGRFKDKLSKDAIYQVLQISEFRCVYCRRELDPNKWHLDHYLPKARGGKNTIDNICPSCSDCNMMKGALMPATFVKNCYTICMNNGVSNRAFKMRYQSFLKEDEDFRILKEDNIGVFCFEQEDIRYSERGRFDGPIDKLTKEILNAT